MPQKLLARLFKQIDKLAKEKAVDYMDNYLKPATPVKTGNLRDSWQIEQTDKNVKVLTDVDYAHYVEYGTSTAAPRAFVRSSYKEWYSRNK